MGGGAERERERAIMRVSQRFKKEEDWTDFK